MQTFEMELVSWESVNDLSPEKDGSLMKAVKREGNLAVWDKPQDADLVTVAASARVAGADAPFLEARPAAAPLRRSPSV
jgi:predicted nuclease with RNAse H fold